MRTYLRHLIILFIVLFHTSFHVAAQNTDKDILRSGRLLFQVNCSRCHGMLGGGGTGPNLIQSYLPRASTDEKLASVISNGIPGTGMPSAWTLTEKEVNKVVKYVKYLGQGIEPVVKGDVTKGKTLFEKSACSTCHIISGYGGSLGPDLTKVGMKRGQKYLVASIEHPGEKKPTDANGFYQFLVVNVTLKNGKIVTGIRINEDTFSIQLKDAFNRLYSFKKKDIQSIKRNKDKSLMPSFEDQLSSKELNDIAAYLTSLK